MENRSQTGARSATGRTQHGLGWVPWTALLVLLLLVAGGVLLALNTNDNDDDPVLGVNDDGVSAVRIPTPTDLAATSEAILITTGASQ